MLSSLPERTPAVVLVGAYESSDSSRVRFLAPQLGIERLAAYVRSQGFDVLTIDPNIDDLNQFRKLFQSKEPLVVGFSISYVTLINDFSLIYFVKKNSPSSLIVAGGQQATFDYKEILEIAPVDIVVLGEGEFPFLEIVKAAAANKDVFGISGIVYKKDKEVIRNGNNRPLSKSEFIQMTLNVDFRKINYRKYWDQIASFYESPNYSEIKTIRLFTVNYCPMQCTFCSSRTFQNAANGSVDEQFNLKGASTKMIGLDSPDLINLINNALKCYPDTRRFYLQEDEHLLLKNRVEQFCEDIISLKSKGELPEDLEFMCQARVEDVNKPLLRLMKSAGYAVIGYGVESFSKKMLDSVKKRNTVEEVHFAIEETINSGIKPFVNLICFFPEITLEELYLTIDSALDYIERGVEVATEPFVMPLPGSALFYDQSYEKHTSVVTIPGTKKTVDRVHFLVPQDPQMKDLTYRFFHEQDNHMNSVARKYGFDHLPTRLRSIVTFDTILTLLQDEGRLGRVDMLYREMSREIRGAAASPTKDAIGKANDGAVLRTLSA